MLSEVASASGPGTTRQRWGLSGLRFPAAPGAGGRLAEFAAQLGGFTGYFIQSYAGVGAIYIVVNIALSRLAERLADRRGP